MNWLELESRSCVCKYFPSKHHRELKCLPYHSISLPIRTCVHIDASGVNHDRFVTPTCDVCARVRGCRSCTLSKGPCRHRISKHPAQPPSTSIGIPGLTPVRPVIEVCDEGAQRTGRQVPALVRLWRSIIVLRRWAFLPSYHQAQRDIKRVMMNFGMTLDLENSRLVDISPEKCRVPSKVLHRDYST